MTMTAGQAGAAAGVVPGRAVYLAFAAALRQCHHRHQAPRDTRFGSSNDASSRDHATIAPGKCPLG